MSSPERQAPVSHTMDSPFHYEYNLRRIFHQQGIDIDQLDLLIDQIRKELGLLFVGKEKEFEALLAELAATRYINKEDLIRIFGEKLSKFTKSNFALVELEKRVRDVEIERKDRVRLSNILSCNFRKNHPNEVSLHFIPSAALPQREILKGIREGLAKLAQLLEEDPTFRKAVSIFARSWIIKNNLTHYEKLGFTILDENEVDRELKTRSARMSREDFIARNKKSG